MTEYSKRDIAKILGKSHRNITYWTDFGLVIPDIQPSQGRGIARIYSGRNLIEFGMIEIMLNQYGISLDNIRYILKVLREGDYQRMTGFPSMEAAERGDASDVNWSPLQEFRDFYESTQWGESIELLYIENFPSGLWIDPTTDKILALPIISFVVVEPDFTYDEILNPGIFKTEFPEVVSKLVWLGKVKKIASQLVGV